MAAVAERIAAGVAWLDAHHPGWVAGVNPARLRIRDAEQCVLGQVLGSYYRAPIRVDQGVPLGFDAEGDEHEDREFAELQAAWEHWFEMEAARRASACCPCRGLLCDPGCPCTSCPKTEEDVADA